MSEVEDLFAAAATADQADAGIGVIWFAKHPPGDYAVTLLAYDRWDMPDVNAAWVDAFFQRSAELAEKHKPTHRGCVLYVEHPGLIEVLKRADEAWRDTPAVRRVDRLAYDIKPVREYDSKKWAPTLDERMYTLRPLVNSGKVIKLDTGLSGLFSRTNNLVSQIKRHKPGDAASAGELLGAFVLGALLGTTNRPSSFFAAMARMEENDARIAARARGEVVSTPSSGPFGAYISGKRPL